MYSGFVQFFLYIYSFSIKPEFTAYLAGPHAVCTSPAVQVENYAVTIVTAETHFRVCYDVERKYTLKPPHFSPEQLEVWTFSERNQDASS